MASATSPEPTEASSENPYILSLQKQMRAINKKLSGMAKTDAVLKENPNVSLDDLVAQRKLNQDQKASALKKPQLQAQLVTLDEQVQQYKKFDAEFQQQLLKQKTDLTSTHSEELEKIKKEAQAEAAARSQAELKSKLLIFSQFLRAAAARRNAEEDSEEDENRAFEGTLLLVYGGDQKAVETALNLIEGSDEQVTSIEGTLLPVKCRFSYFLPLLSRISLTFNHSLSRQGSRSRTRACPHRGGLHRGRSRSCHRRLRPYHHPRWPDRAPGASDQRRGSHYRGGYHCCHPDRGQRCRRELGLNYRC